jgi:hypothetical protein
MISSQVKYDIKDTFSVTVKEHGVSKFRRPRSTQPTAKGLIFLPFQAFIIVARELSLRPLISGYESNSHNT